MAATSASEPLRVGVIGAGSIADLGHFPSIRAIVGTRLEATCDPVDAFRERARTKWAIPHVFDDYRRLLDLKQLDIVIVASPNVFHHEQAKAALEAGKHVIIEKPFACTNQEAWDIVRTAERTKRKVMVGCNYRFWEQHLIAKQLIESGVIGSVKMGSSKSHEGWHLYHEMISATRFRQDPKLAGAGALFDLGSHMTDLLIWLMGKKPKRVCGTAVNLTRPPAYTVLDDCVYIQIEFEDGTRGMVDLNRFSPAVTQGCEILGTEGTILTCSEAQNPFQSAPLAVYSNLDYCWEDLPEVMRDYRYPQTFWAQDNFDRPLKKRWIPIYPPRGWAYKKMLEQFVDAIVNDRPPIIKAEDGAWTMEVLCAVFASMKAGGWVDLPLAEEVVPPHFEKRSG
ncbi:MAG TPA: Gfo/Idh/MocA family oxidoreductase [Rectinemataceae bacterium]|nr:Gfo/Idh/MocA family oxidoreductase [Rectinemataceae bacterium]